MTRVTQVLAVLLFCAYTLLGTGQTFAQDFDQITTGDLSNAHLKSAKIAPHDHTNGQAHARFGIFGIDSLANFNGHYFTPGFDSNGNPNNHWYFNTVGNPPQLGGTTTINAPVVPVIMNLLNFDGTPRFVNGKPLVYDATQYAQKVVDSPVFATASYSSSSVPTQFSDAIQRAEYFKLAKADWHTLLAPRVKTTRVMSLVRGTYRFVLNADGSCCRYILVDINAFVNALFPPAGPLDNSTPIGAAELAGDITTADMSTFLFPNTYLYFNNDPNQCCVLGFHSYDVEPGTASNGNRERDYVMNYSSWISPGIFGGGFQDVTAHSHEIAETFNDPFVASNNVNNITPWWLAPNGNCQNDLETGDVIEGLPHAVYPIQLNGFTYHPQNEALLQWFEFQSPSDALGGAYSYPDTTVLTGPSAPQKLNCE